MQGKVWLVGAGPGDEELLTVKGRKMLDKADVIVYDALVSPEIMSLLPSETECIYVGKRADCHAKSQEEINQILVEKAKEGKQVVRLKGGDPFVFGRGGEELELLVKEEIPFEIVPGITSAVAAPAYGGIPVTHRDVTSSFHVITGHGKQGREQNIDFQALVNMDATLIFLMGLSSLTMICQGLIGAGMSPDIPAAVLEKGTTARQRKVVSTISGLEAQVRENGIETPAIIMVGKVCSLADRFSWAEKRPLHGKRYLLTRPVKTVSAMAGRLRDLGAQVIEMPAIATVLIKDHEELLDGLETLGQYEEEWLAFTSPAGVDLFFAKLMEMEFDIRRIFSSESRIRFAAIGKSTAEELKKRGIIPDVIPEAYSAKDLGKALKIAIGKEASGKTRVSAVRARQASPYLFPPLREAGVMCRDIPLYETRYLVNEKLRREVFRLFSEGQIDGVTFTSGSTVRGFVKALEGLDFTRVKGICIGKQTADVASQYGISVRISSEATIDSMMELILSIAEEER